MRFLLFVACISGLVPLISAPEARAQILPPCCVEAYGGEFVDEIEARPTEESLEDLSDWLVRERLADATPADLSMAIGAIEGRCSFDCPTRLVTAKSAIQSLYETRVAEVARRDGRAREWTALLAGLAGSMASAGLAWLVAAKLARRKRTGTKRLRFYERHRDDR